MVCNLVGKQILSKVLKHTEKIYNIQKSLKGMSLSKTTFVSFKFSPVCYKQSTTNLYKIRIFFSIKITNTAW